MSNLDSAQSEFDGWVSRHGYSVATGIVKAWLKRRVDRTDPKLRKKYPWGEVKKMYERQGGFCPLCGNVMPLIRGKIHVDHRDPNAKDFDDRSNLQVVCASCNAKKSSRSIPEQAKHYGRTMRELLE